MEKKVLAIVDMDYGFVQLFNERLKYNDLLDDYEIVLVLPKTTVDVSRRIIECREEIQQLLNTRDVVAVFVDIVVDESGEGDDSGIDIAIELKKSYPSLPIFNITAKITNLSDRDAISRASLEKTDGVLLKSYLHDKTFTESRLKKILKSAKEKIVFQGENGTSLITTKIPEEIHKNFNLGAIEPKVQNQIDEIGANVFWTLVSNLKPGASGTISYMRPGRSGAYVFKLFINTKKDGQSTTLPKPWILKVSNNPDLLEGELNNYLALKDVPLYRTFYPQVLTNEIVRVDGFGAFLIELEEGAETLAQLFPTFDLETVDIVIEGIKEFFNSTYGDPTRHPVNFWEEFYMFNDSTINKILAELSDFESLFKDNFEPIEFETVQSFVKKQDPIYKKIQQYQANADQRTIHGDFNSGNILINPNKQVVFIDFSARGLGHIVYDAAKLERDIVFRIFDRNSFSNYDWARLDHWANFSELNTSDNFFDREFVEIEKQPELNKAITLIKGVRNNLKQVSSDITQREYLYALLHFSLLAIVHPDFSFQKRVFAVRYAYDILKSL